jgi:hypothetical protein
MQRESPRLPWIATLVLVTANVSETTAVTLTRLKEAGRRVCLVCLADTLPAHLPPVLTYHVPATMDAFQDGHNLTDSRLAGTLAALGRIPTPDINGNPPASRWERHR